MNPSIHLVARLLAAALVLLLAACRTDVKKLPISELPPVVDGGLGSSSTLVPWLAATGRYGYADRDGVMKIEPRFDGAALFYEGLAAVYDGDWGFIQPSGKYQIPPKYQAVRDFRGGKAVAYRFKGPWLGPIMGLILKHGELTTLELDRSGAVLSTDVRQMDVLEQPRMPDDLFRDRYERPPAHSKEWGTRPEDAGFSGKQGLFHKPTGRQILEPRFDEAKLLHDVDGSGPKMFAGRLFNQPWAVYDLTGKLLLDATLEVADYASEGCFLAAAGASGWYAAYDGAGKRVVDAISAYAYVFRDGVAEAYVADVGVVFVDRKGRIYADLEYIKAKHRAIGRAE